MIRIRNRTICLLTAMLLLLLLLSAAAIPVAADPESGSAEGSSQAETSEETSSAGEEPAPKVYTEFHAHNPGMAFCMDTGQVLFEDRVDQVVGAGVITKLAALMVAHDLLRATDRPLSTRITLEADWLKDSYTAGDRSTPYIGLEAGEEVTLEYLFLSTLVANANDSCAALVRYVSAEVLLETEQGFLAKMNEKAAALGMENTRFNSATGYKGSASVTTVRDAVKLLAAFYSYNELVEGANCYSYGTLRNKNYLLCDKVVAGYMNKQAVGLIAGQATNDGNYSLATYSVKDGRVYVYLFMGGSGERVGTDGSKWFDEGNVYEDMNALLPWVDESFGFVTLCAKDDLVAELRMGEGAEADHLILVPEREAEMLIFAPEDGVPEAVVSFDGERVYEAEFNGKMHKCVDAPVKQGDVLGSVTYFHKGKELVTLKLVARDSVQINELRQAMNRVRTFLFDGPMSKIILVVLILIGLWILLALTLFVLKIVRRIRARKNVNKL